MKICQVIFSTNRLEYLTRTLEAQKHLNFEGCEVDKIFIDDYPKGRNDILLTFLVQAYGYNEIYLHSENQGLSTTWTEFWNLIKDRDYDYIWHQEDDVELLEPVRILDLVELLQHDQTLSQVVLTRQSWYYHETDPVAEETDILFKNFRCEKNSVIFSPMASLYSIDKVRFSYSDWYRIHYPDENLHSINLNEGMIGNALGFYGQLAGKLKNADGKNLINHIGEYFVGKRVLPNEPHYEMFAMYDPDKKYNSRNGSAYE